MPARQGERNTETAKAKKAARAEECRRDQAKLRAAVALQAAARGRMARKKFAVRLDGMRRYRTPKEILQDRYEQWLAERRRVRMPGYVGALSARQSSAAMDHGVLPQSPERDRRRRRENPFARRENPLARGHAELDVHVAGILRNGGSTARTMAGASRRMNRVSKEAWERTAGELNRRIRFSKERLNA